MTFSTIFAPLSTLTKVTRAAALVAFFTAALLLSACGTTSPDAALETQGLKNFTPVPMTKVGSDKFFAQLEADRAVFKDAARAFSTQPREALKQTLILSKADVAYLDKLTDAQVDLLVHPLNNMLETTLSISNGILMAQSSSTGPKYYLQHYRNGVGTGKFHLVDPWLIMEIEWEIIKAGGIPTPQAVDEWYDALRR